MIDPTFGARAETPVGAPPLRTNRGDLIRNEAASAVLNCYDDTNSIAQKSLVRCAPLIGALSGLTREPVRYW